MKTDYDTKVKGIEKKITDHTHDDYITTPEFNKLKLAQADLVTKTYFDNKMTSINRKIFSNKMNNLITENKLKKFNLIRVVFVVKIILMKMVLKIGLYFNQWGSI